jgi:hypothetical protein
LPTRTDFPPTHTRTRCLCAGQAGNAWHGRCTCVQHSVREPRQHASKYMWHTRCASFPPKLSARVRTLVRAAPLASMRPTRGRKRIRRAQCGREMGSDLKFSAVFGTMSSNSSNTKRSTLPPPASVHNSPARSAREADRGKCRGSTH